MNIDLSVIVDMQSKTIRFNRGPGFSTLNTDDIIAAVVGTLPL